MFNPSPPNSDQNIECMYQSVYIGIRTEICTYAFLREESSFN